MPTIRHRHDAETIDFDFPLIGTIVARDGDNLSFTPPNGEKYVLANFFNVEPGQELPCLIFADSEELSVVELHALLSVEQNTGDFETKYMPAEGPTAQSSGLGDYSEDGGVLLAGVDRLGMLDPSSSLLASDAYEFPDYLNYTDSGAGASGPGGSSWNPSGTNDLTFSEDYLQTKPLMNAASDEQVTDQLAQLREQYPDATFEVPSGEEVGQYGILTLLPDGTWTYNLTADINSMGEGQGYTDSFPVIIRQPDGTEIKWQIDVVITGDNDAPTVQLAYADTDDAAMTRTGALGTKGQMEATDPEGNTIDHYTDGTPTVWLIVTNPDGSETRTMVGAEDYGHFDMLDNGSWTFAPDPNSPDYELQIKNLLALAPGQRVEIKVPVTATDSIVDADGNVIAGAEKISDPTDLTITITGTEQGPQFDASTLADDTTEDNIMFSGQHSFSGDQFVAPDPENESVTFGDNNVVPAQPDETIIEGLYGDLYLQSNGEWTYKLHDGLSIDFMTSDPDYKYQETFKITAIDANGNSTTSDFVLTIQGNNDVPIITGAKYGDYNFENVDAQGSMTVLSGQVFGADIDTNDSVLYYERSGPFTAHTEEPIIAPAARAAVALAAAGPVTTEAVNPNDYGELVLNKNADGLWDGTWSFVAKTPEQQANLQALGNKVLVLNFDVIAYDHFAGKSAPHPLTIYVNGDNTFEPDFGTDSDFAVSTSENHLTTTGNLTGSITGTDSDGDQLTYSLVGLKDDAHTAHGAFVIKEDGTWVYTPTQNINSLEMGEIHTHTYIIRIMDGNGGETTRELVLTFTGNNDDPIVADVTATINDQGLAGDMALTGTIAAPDADDNATATFTDNTLTITLTSPGGTTNITATQNSNGTWTSEYGDFTLNANGTWRFEAVTADQKAKSLALGQGDSLSIKVGLTANDGKGTDTLDPLDPPADGKDDGVLTITVVGTNQVPVFVGSTLSDGVLEHVIMGDGLYTTQNQLKATDVDSNDDTLTFSIKGDTGSGVEGLYGTFTMTEDGIWTFTLKDGEDGNISFLPGGVSYTETFTALVTDEHGGTSEQVVSLTITGDNDAPVVDDATGTASDMYMYGGQTLTGQVVGSDPDLGDSVQRYNFGAATASITGSDTPVNINDYGVLRLNSDGSWSLQAVTDTQKANMRALGENENLVITVPVSATDRQGETSDESSLTITVTGTNQAPEYVGSTLDDPLTEDSLTTGDNKITGKFEATDPDGDDISYSIKPGNDESTHGRFNVNPDGTWDYTPTDDINKLAEGETITEKVTVTITDESGGSTDVEYEITITGTNDAPTLTSATAKSTDADLRDDVGFSGNITATDPEGDAITYSYGEPALNLSDGDTPLNLNDYGNLTLNPDGSWSFTAETQDQKDALLGLGRGDSLTITVPVTATDSNNASSNPGTITITITGTNQAPTFSSEIGSDVLKTVTEDEIMADSAAGREYTGNMAAVIEDIDGDTITYSTLTPTVKGLYGTFSVDADGNWHYKPNAGLDLNFMTPDDTYQDTFTIIASDGQGGTTEQAFTINITGVNDVPVITGSSHGATDLDDTDNDGAVLTGSVTATDVDAGDSIVSYAQDEEAPIVAIIRNQDGSTADTLTADEINAYGRVVFDPDGSGNWSFVTDDDAANLKSLPIGQSLVISVPVIATDTYGGEGKGTINIEIRGTNSVPIFDTTTLYVRTNEDTVIDNGLTGQLKVSNDDGDDFTYYSLAGDSQGDYGALTLNTDGTWVYTPTTDINVFAPGVTYEETFQVRVSDGRGGEDLKTLYIRITGDNDAPRVIGAELDADDSTIIAGTAVTGTVTGIDVDIDDSITYSTGTLEASLEGGTPTDANEYGFFKVDPVTGAWTFQATTQAQQDKMRTLADGEELVITAQVVVTDESGAKGYADVEITITGSNDGPILQDTSGSDTDLAMTTVPNPADPASPFGPGLQGNITGWDPEDGDNAFTFNDGAATATISSTIGGTTSSKGAIASDYGELVIDPATGHWTFKPMTKAQQDKILSLREGDTLVINVPVNGTDADGATGADATLTITITGTNQGPTITESSLMATTHEDTLLAADATGTGISGRITGSDPDGGTLAYDTTPIAGKYGTLTLTADGLWTYKHNPDVDIDFMNKDQTYQETFTILVSDGQGGTTEKTFTLDIVGDNDNPHIINTSQGELTENILEDTPALTGNVLAHDHDEGDTIVSYVFTDGTTATLGDTPINVTYDGDGNAIIAGYGLLTMDETTGAWSLTPTTPEQATALNSLPEDQALVINVTVDVTDSSGGKSSMTFPITVNGTNTAPGILPGTGENSLDINTTEDALLATLLPENEILSGTVQVRNDDGDTLSYNIASARGGTYGMLTLAHDTGEWTYTPYTDLDKLYEGQTYTDVFLIQVSDGRGGVDTQELTVTITGNNDAPVLTADSRSYTDTYMYGDGETSLSGDLACTGSLGVPGATGVNADINNGAYDVDTGDAVTFTRGTTTVALDGSSTGLNPDSYGYFTLDKNGNWTFESETAAQKQAVLALREGEQLVLVMNVTGTDKSGAAVNTQVAITITGTNQAPVLEDVSATYTDTQFTPANPATPISVGGDIPGLDPEDGENITFVQGAATATINGVPADLSQYGVLEINPNTGAWAFTANDAAQQAKLLSLGNGESLIITLPVHGTDSDGASGADATLTITINGSNQGPIVDPNNTSFNVETQEDYLIRDAEHNLTGTLMVNDPDGDAVTYTPINEIVGQWGTFSLDANGNWTYTVKPGLDINFMDHRVDYTETFSVTMRDSNGSTVNQDFNLTIVGSNDIPVINNISISTPFGQTPPAIGQAVVAGQVYATDPDASGTVDSYAIQANSTMATLDGAPVAVTYDADGNAVIGDYGVLDIDPDTGAWSLTPTNQTHLDNLNALAGRQLVVKATMVVTDNDLGTGSKILTLTLNGTNTVPELDPNSLTGNTGMEDAVILAGLEGDLAITAGSEDAADTLTFSLTSDKTDANAYNDNGQGMYGNLTIDAEGHWKYTPTEDINFLRVGDSYEEKFLVQVSDGLGGTDTKEITITITGQNDAPVLTAVTDSVDDSALLDGTPITGTITGKDADTGPKNPDGTDADTKPDDVTPTDDDTITYSADNVVATLDGDTTDGTAGTPVNINDYGTLKVNPDGTWSFQAQSQEQKDNLEKLGPNQSITITADITGTDTNSGTGTTTITLTVNGTNQAPTLQDESAKSTDAAMASGSALSGSLMGYDPEGDSITYDFNINDITATVDGVEVHLGEYGDFEFDTATGKWTLQANSQDQKDKMLSLGEGQNLVVIIPVSGTDENGAASATPDKALTITITGSSQGPSVDATTLLANTNEDTLMADGNPGIKGQLAATDPDSNNTDLTYTPTPAGGVDGKYGTFTLDEDGNWTYKLKPGMDIDFMAPGENYQETFTVQVKDSTGQITEREFTVDITGNNDNPEIVDVSQGTLTLPPTFTPDTPVLSGSILATDPDAGDTVDNYKVSGTPTATIIDDDPATPDIPVNLDDYGKLDIDPDTGTWTFTPETADQLKNLQDLIARGDTLDITANVVAEDSNGGSVTAPITITVGGPANTPPAFDTNSLAKTGDEDDVISNGLSGDLLITTGLDAGETLTYSLAPDPVSDPAEPNDGTYGQGKYGNLTLNEDGSWVYTPTQDINWMAEGETYTETFYVRVSDGKGGVEEKPLVITINGDNDAPVIGDATADLSDVGLANGLSYEGTVTLTDVDDANTSTPAFSTPTGITGSISVDGAPGTAADYSQYGDFTFDNATGKWTFTANSTTQKNNLLALGEGETLTITVPLTATDGTDTGNGNLTITITGTNQAPIFDGSSLNWDNADWGNTEPPLGTPVNGSLTATDAEDDTLTYTLKDGATNGTTTTITGQYGNLVLNNDGTWTYTRTSDLSSLPAGQNAEEQFTVMVSDGNGGLTEDTLTITVKKDDPANTAPDLADSAPVNTTDVAMSGGAASVGGSLTATDAEGDPVTISNGEPTAMLDGKPVNASDYGDFVLNPNNTWTFTATTDEQKQNMLALGDGTNLVVTVPVSATDDQGASDDSFITITVAGTNQAPTVTVDDPAPVDENTLQRDGSISGQLSATDPDSGDELTYGVKADDGEDKPNNASTGPESDSIKGEYGVITVDDDGKWTYVPTGKANELPAGETADETFWVTVSDGHGGTSEQPITITITGSNDAPIMQADTRVEATETDLNYGTELTGVFSGIDPDLGDSLTYSTRSVTATLNGAEIDPKLYGDLVVDPATGTWTFKANTAAQQARINALNPTDALEITAVVRGTDQGNADGSNKLFDEGNLVIAITGVNQPTTIQDATADPATDQQMYDGDEISGQMVGTDPEGEVTFSVADTNNDGNINGDDLTAVITLNGTETTVDASDYGTLFMGPDGKWAFQAQTQEQRDNMLALKPGESLVITVPVQGSQGEGGTPADATLTITVTGADQAPVVDDTSATATDAAMRSGTELSGSILGYDPEGNPLTFTEGTAIITGGADGLTLDDYGVLTVNPDGTWSFTAQSDIQKANMQALGEGQNLVITVPVTGNDGALTDSGNLVITITGTSQGPNFEADSLLYETHEDDLITADGLAEGDFAATDPDGDTDLTYTAGASTGKYGTLTVDEDGHWTYQIQPGQDINFMAPGENYQETFTVSVTDSDGVTTEREFVVNIAGDNDAPVINGVSQNEPNFDAPGGDVLTGNVLATDPDVGDTPGNYRLNGDATGTIDGKPVNLADYGELVVDPDGSWRFMATTPTQQDNLRNLGDKELVIDAQVASTDDHGKTGYGEITVTVNGDNTTPVMNTGGLMQNVREDALIENPLTGKLNATDAEGDTLTYSLAEDNQGNYGSISLAEDGTWTYTPTMDINFMSSLRETPYTETFRVRVSDGKGGVEERDLTINILGDNDAPVVGDVTLTTSDMELISGMEFTGDIPLTIIDAGDTATLSTTAVTASRSTQKFDENGDPVMDANGDPVVTEGGAIAENFGTFVLDPATNTWTFAATTPEQQARLLALAEGETLTITAILTATDQSGMSSTGELTITITGSNQAPVFTGSSLSAFTSEDALMADTPLTGTLVATDPDKGAVLTYELAGDGQGTDALDGTVGGLYGTLTLDPATGKWTYTRDPNLDLSALEPGQNYTEEFVVRVTDEFGAVTEETLTINISGTNDDGTGGSTARPPVMVDDSAIVTDEDLFGGVPQTGNLSLNDTNGANITYTEGEPTAMIGDTEIKFTEDNGKWTSDYGDLVINDNGTWTFTATTPEQQEKMKSLPEGESLVIRVPVTGDSDPADPNNPTGETSLTITVAGTNQAPELGTITPPSGDEDTPITGQFTATDPDTGDELTYSVKPYNPNADPDAEPEPGEGSVKGDYGILTVDDDGKWTYTPTNEADKLGAGEEAEETFTVVVSDGKGGTHEQQITISLTGTNDAPVLDDLTVTTSDAALGSGKAISGTMSGFDVDGDNITFDAGSITATIGDTPVAFTQDPVSGKWTSDYGNLVMNDDGTWTFRAETAEQRENMLKLGPTDTLEIDVTVTGSDGNGGSDSGTLSITVQGSDQKANTVTVITDPNGIRTHEDAMMKPDFILNGTLAVADPEGGSISYYLTGPDGTASSAFTASPSGIGATLDGKYGTLTLGADGNWTYTRFTNAEGESMDLNFMNAGQDYIDTFTVYAQDGNGAWSEREISIIIAGDNDAPTLLGVSQPGLLDSVLGTVLGADALKGRIVGFDADEGDRIHNYHIVAGSSLVLEISGHRLDLSNLGDLLDGLLDGADPLLNIVGGALDLVLDTLNGILEVTGVNGLLLINPEDGTFNLAAGPLGGLLGAVETLTDTLRELLDTLAGLDSNLVDVLLEALPWLGLEGEEDLLRLLVMVEAEDQHGASTGPKEIGVNLVGGNNKPVFDGDDIEQTLGEDALLAAHFISGTLSASDSEDDPLSYYVQDGGHGEYGSLTVNPDGTWTYTITDADKVNALNAGDPAVSDTFTVVVEDGHGGYDTKEITVNITGANDAPIFDVQTLGATVVEDDLPPGTTEDPVAKYTGKIDATDADSLDTDLEYSINGATTDVDGNYTYNGTYGTFTMDADGNWNYTPGAGMIGLNLGQTGTEKITITVSDGHGGTQQRDFTLTVVGTNNDPVPAMDALAGNWGAILTGKIGSGAPGETYEFALRGVSNPDGFPQAIIGKYGTMTLLDAEGNFTYTPVPGFEHDFMSNDPAMIAEYQEVFTFIVTNPVTGERMEQNMGFTPDELTRINNAPQLNGTTQSPGQLQDDGSASLVALEGKIQAYDPDDGATLRFDEDLSRQSALVLDGVALNEDAISGVLSAVFEDVLGGLYSVFIAGPILKGLVDGIVVNTLGGLLDTLLTPITTLLGDVVGKGLITIDEDTGKWTIAADALEPLLKLVDDLVNGLITGLTEPIRALADNPALNVLGLGPLIGGILDRLPFVGYNRDSSVLGLDIPITVGDGTVTIPDNIQIDLLGGLNSKPQFTQNDAESQLTRSVSEDDLQNQHFVTGTLKGTDADTVDVLDYVLNTKQGNWDGHGTYGKLSLETNGEWTYTLTKDISGLAQGESYTERFEVIVRDGRGGQDVKEIQITINGTNDAPTFVIDTLDRTFAETQLVDGMYSGQLEARDADTSLADLTYTITQGGLNAGYTVTSGEGFTRITETDGSVFTLYADGRWTYKPTFDLDPALTDGGLAELMQKKFGVTVTDDHGASSNMDFNLNMVGTNEAPDITTTVEVNEVMTNEDAMMAPGFAISGTLRSEDPDGNAVTGNFTLPGGGNTVTGMYGTLTLNANGEWTYERIPGVDLDFMGPDQRYTDSFTVISGGAESKINFSISGDNDAPIIVGVDTGVFVFDLLPGQDLTQDMEGRILVYDPDEGDRVSGFHITSTIPILEIAGQRIDLSRPGDLLDGLLDSADPLLNLVGGVLEGVLGAVGEILQGTGVDSLLTLNDDGSFSLVAGPLNDILNLLGGITDTLLALPLVAQLGDFVLDPVFEALPWLEFDRQEDVLTIHVNVEAHDKSGASTGETEISIDVVGGNSSPYFVAAPGSTTPSETGVVEQVTESALLANHTIVEGTLSAADGDDAAADLRYYIVGDEPGLSGSNGRYGSLTLDEVSGEWVYTLTKAGISTLDPGEKYTEAFTVMVSDGHGGQDTQTISIEILGDDGAPAARMMAAAAPAMPSAAESPAEFADEAGVMAAAQNSAATMEADSTTAQNNTSTQEAAPMQSNALTLEEYLAATQGGLTGEESGLVPVHTSAMFNPNGLGEQNDPAFAEDTEVNEFGLYQLHGFGLQNQSTEFDLSVFDDFSEQYSALGMGDLAPEGMTSSLETLANELWLNGVDASDMELGVAGMETLGLEPAFYEMAELAAESGLAGLRGLASDEGSIGNHDAEAAQSLGSNQSSYEAAALSFAENTTNDQDSELRVLQIAMQNG
jgi:VCBS repeat-containing protein